MPVYAYCRVSKESQVKEGHSLETQDRIIRGYTHMYNLPLTSTFVEEGVSASIPLFDRPQGKLLYEILKPGDVIITSKLDRMFRSALDALTTLKYLQKRKIALHMIDFGGNVNTSAYSTLMFTMLSAFAEMERGRASERIKDVKKNQKSKGKFLGGRQPFGYTRTETNDLQPCPTQQQIIKDIHFFHRKGHSLRAIAKVTGLSHGGVRKILNRL